MSGLSRRWRAQITGSPPSATAAEIRSGLERGAPLPVRESTPVSELASLDDQPSLLGQVLGTAARARDGEALRTPEVSASVLNGRPVHYSVETTDVFAVSEWVHVFLPGLQHALQGLQVGQQRQPEHVLWEPGPSAATPEGQRDVELLAALTVEERDFVERCLLEALQRNGPRSLPRGNLHVEPLNPIETLAFFRSRENSPVVACTSRYQLTWVARERAQWSSSVAITLVTPPPVRAAPEPQGR